jgi:hypothetical protein
MPQSFIWREVDSTWLASTAGLPALLDALGSILCSSQASTVVWHII